jgi:hypothetical protein
LPVAAPGFDANPAIVPEPPQGLADLHAAKLPSCEVCVNGLL